MNSDIMADNMVDTNSMAGKVVTILIALLFIVVLAFPIANSLGNMGSGSGESAPITYTNSGDFYYKSATADSNEHTLTVDYTLLFDEEDELNDTIELNILLDDVSIYAHTFENVNDNVYEYATPLLLAYNDTGYLTLWSGRCEWMLNTGTYPVEHILFKESSATDLDNGQNIITTLTIQNGVLHYTSDSTQEEDSLNIDYFLSNDGDYVMADAPAYVSKDNTEVYVYDYDSDIFCSISGQFNTSNILSNTQSLNGLVQVSGITWVTVTDGSYSGTLKSVTENGLLKLEYIDSEYAYTDDGNESTGSKQTTQFIVPTTVTVEDDGAGSGSDSDGIGGVASTLVKLVPILLIVGLLMIFVIPIVNRPN